MKVTKEEFEKALDAYGRHKLTCDTTAICDPPRTRYHDFSHGRIWPEGLVGYIVREDLWDDAVPRPNEYWIEDHVVEFLRQ